MHESTCCALCCAQGGKIRKQIIQGAECSEMMASVHYDAIVGDFYMWPILHALKYRPADGSDPHILDMYAAHDSCSLHHLGHTWVTLSQL